MSQFPQPRYIADGEPVSAGVTNRPLQQLDLNQRQLYDILQAAAIGSAIYARAQTVASTVLVGQPVFFNTTNNRFEAAYAAAATDAATGYLVIPEHAQVWGLVSKKHNSTLADILLQGVATLNITNAVGADLTQTGEVPPGLWYLAGQGSGNLTRQTPPVSIPVCRTSTNNTVYVNTKIFDFLENHRHYKFPLLMQPAGTVTPPAPGGTHTITSPDSSLQGWLPASDPIFNGLAPAEAKFGYNLSQDLALAQAYPPVPLQSACVIMQRPSIYDSAGTRSFFGQQLLDDLVIVDRNGIWWLSDCYDNVPWPTDLDTESSLSTSVGACNPAARLPSLLLYFTRVGFATDNSSVTSLSSLDPRLTVRCAGQTSAGSTGDLEIDLDLSFMIGSQTQGGSQVIKTFNPVTNTFNFGPVCEGVVSASSNVLLSGTSQTISGQQVYQGVVGISVLTSSTRELSSQLVRLDGVTEESYPVLYLGMPDTNTTSYVVKFEIPGDAPAGSNFQFRLRLLGRAAGTLPQLTAEYYKAARPSNGLTTPVPVVQTYTGLSITTVATVGANQAVEATSTAVPVNPGDIVYIQVQRTPSAVGDAYAGELGVMQQLGVLTSA